MTLNITFKSVALVATLLAFKAYPSPMTSSDPVVTHPADALAQSYRHDLGELFARIKQEHPRPFRMLSEAGFEQLVDGLQASFDERSNKTDVLWAFSEVIAALGCGHSRMPYFNQEEALIKPADRFPTDVRWVDNRLLVLDPFVNNDSLAVGDEVTAINGRPVQDIVDEIYRHIGADANLPYYKRHMFNVSATSYLTYALGFPERYEVAVVGQNQPLSLKPLSEFAHRPIVDPRDPCQKSLCYRVDDTTNTGILSLRSFNFYAERGQIFADFVDEAFADLVEHNRHALIIDVRGNHGGSGLAGAYVLRRLASQPFAYFSDKTDKRASNALMEIQQPVDTGFEGKTFVLMNGSTTSSVPHFLALVKEHNMATLVGEPAGGNFSTTDGKKRFVSSEQGIEYFIARMRFDVAAPSLGIDDGIEPDVSLPYGVKQTLTREDLMLQSLLSTLGAKKD